MLPAGSGTASRQQVTLKVAPANTSSGVGKAVNPNTAPTFGAIGAPGSRATLRAVKAMATSGTTSSPAPTTTSSGPAAMPASAGGPGVGPPESMQFPPRSLPNWPPSVCTRTGLPFTLSPPHSRDVQTECGARMPSLPFCSLWAQEFQRAQARPLPPLVRRS